MVYIKLKNKITHLHDLFNLQFQTTSDEKKNIRY